jgi:hypothetical protein
MIVIGDNGSGQLTLVAPPYGAVPGVAGAVTPAVAPVRMTAQPPVARYINSFLSIQVISIQG